MIELFVHFINGRFYVYVCDRSREASIKVWTAADETFPPNHVLLET